MYDSAEDRPNDVFGKYQQVQRISAYGVTWVIAYKSKKEFDAVNASSLPLVVLIMGASIGLLLFFLMSLALQQRDRAIQLAMEMTREIRAQSLLLYDSEERFELAMRGANDGLWDRNVELGTVYFSPRWKIILGYADDELLNSYEEWIKRIHPDDVAQLLKKEKHYMDGVVERFQNEYRLRHKDGSYIWVMDRGLIQFGENGKVSRFVGVISDITEQKRIDKLKSEFISTVSHELRTPLTSIAASLGLLEAGVFGDLPSKALGLVAIANKNSKRLTLLVNDILDMEKLMSGSTVFRIDQIDMMEIVKQAIELNTEYANSYGVQFSLSTPTESHRIVGDRDRLMQIMANLMSNAAKFSPAGSVVYIRLIRKKTMVRVEIEDQGSGIPDEFRSRIFTEFAQADSSDTRRQGGTGLGLNITKKIVERMNGEIGYETEIGKGSIFWFALPYVVARGKTDNA
jgi:PAS domain S-box-containing protein